MFLLHRPAVTRRKNTSIRATTTKSAVAMANLAIAIDLRMKTKKITTPRVMNQKKKFNNIRGNGAATSSTKENITDIDSSDRGKE